MASESPKEIHLPRKWSDIFQNKSYVFSSSHVESLIPKLTESSHKGSHGRIAIFGGSEKYTGAPYYAASAALHCGVDLVTVFCAKEASIPLKCYSPELMVQSVYSVDELEHFSAEDATLRNKMKDEQDSKKMELLEMQRRILKDKQQLSLHMMVSTVTAAFPSLHALCIGPGMGRHELLYPAITAIIEKAIKSDLPLVLDADALYMLSLDEHRDLLLQLLQYEHVVMTPNLMECKRLKDALQKGISKEKHTDNHFANAGIIVQKGSSDIITQQSITLECKEKGGLKRSGGIGDVLAGTISAFMAWNTILEPSANANNGETVQHDQLMATWTACCVVKKATRRAFDRKRRCMSAQHVLDEIGGVIGEMEHELEHGMQK